jgi:hypothetical protein
VGSIIHLPSIYHDDRERSSSEQYAFGNETLVLWYQKGSRTSLDVWSTEKRRRRVATASFVVQEIGGRLVCQSVSC